MEHCYDTANYLLMMVTEPDLKLYNTDNMFSNNNDKDDNSWTGCSVSGDSLPPAFLPPLIH